MPAASIASVLAPSARFVRSVHLERDFQDPTALQGYVVTPHARTHAVRLAEGLSPGSSQRAWRVTGDYGCGKSSFALAIAHTFSGRKDLPESLRDFIDLKKYRPEFVPVLITGSREPMTLALLRALRTALESTCVRGAPPSILKRIVARLESVHRKELTEHELIELVVSVNQYVQMGRNRTGLLIIMDELGKFLEFAAMNPERQDIFFLQRLAETAARSGDSPMFVVGVLHQNFNAYSDQLAPTAQREWEKVAGRFDEVVFQQPMEQMASLVSHALSVRERELPSNLRERAKADMAQAIALRWYGPGVATAALSSAAPRLYPLHPSVLPVLIGLLSRFGQNERSLFGFLFSNEPYGLKQFSERPIAAGTWYRLHDLYDYARSNLGHRLSIQSYRSHWAQIESAVLSFASEDSLELRILKSVALLNLLDREGLLADEESLALALASDTTSPKQIRTAITALKTRCVLYHRGAAGGFCLWPHTSVNLERAYDTACKALGPAHKVAPLVSQQLETRPIVARRHYIKTGNLRYFELEYRAVGDLSPVKAGGKDDPDGRIVIFLCETDEEHQSALEAASNEIFRARNILVAVPRPLQTLAALVQEVTRWHWVAHNIPELNHDSYAAEEVARQIRAAERVRDARLHAYLGLRQFGGRTELRWFQDGKSVSIADARELLEKLSAICDEIFSEAPRIKNELINRRQLSSAAAAARMRLIERTFSSASQPYLGLEEAKAPPEMSMYLSVLKAGELHRNIAGTHRFTQPSASDSCNLRPTLARMLEVLREGREARVNVAALLDAIYQPPYGVREGLGVLLLAVFTQLHENELAFYENGVFLRQMGGAEMHRLVKAPTAFEVQYCKVTGVRSVLFEQLMRVLLPDRVTDGTSEVLNIVRPLCVFAAGLPVYVQRTHRLSTYARDVRSALMTAKEPATLLFKELPRACGFEPFATSGRSGERERAAEFAVALKAAYDELKTAYGRLIAQIRDRLEMTFECRGNIRASLRSAAEPILVAINEPMLRTLCLRFLDEKLGETEWLESIGSAVSEKPPSKWLDVDIEHFNEQLEHLARRFRRVQALRFPTSAERVAAAFHVAITRPDGSELDRILHINTEDELAVSELEAQVRSLLQRHQHIGIAAATRAVWKELERHETKH